MSDGLTLGVGLPPLVFQKAAVTDTENSYWPMGAATPGRRGPWRGTCPRGPLPRLRRTGDYRLLGYTSHFLAGVLRQEPSIPVWF